MKSRVERSPRQLSDFGSHTLSRRSERQRGRVTRWRETHECIPRCLKSNLASRRALIHSASRDLPERASWSESSVAHICTYVTYTPIIDPRRDPRRELDTQVDIHDTLRQFRQVSHVSSSLCSDFGAVTRGGDGRGRKRGRITSTRNARGAVLLARLASLPAGE